MENIPSKVVLIQRDNADQVLDVKGPYKYEYGLEILENGQKKFGGKLFTPEGNHDWAIQWHYDDYNGTYWEIYPIDDKFKYPKHLDN